MLQSLTRHVVVPCAHTTTVHNSYCQSERKCWKRNLFLSLNKPHHPVTSDTIARWLKQVLMEAGVAENSAPSPPVTVQDIVPPCCNKNEHTLDNLHGKCLMAVPIFFHSHSISISNVVQLSHTLQNFSSSCLNISLHTW